MNSGHTVTALVIGESLIDIVGSGDTAVEHPGGSPMNVSFGLGRLGMTVVFLTRLGDDDRGVRIARHLASADVALVAPPRPGERTSTAKAELQADGSAHYDFDIEWALATRDEDLPRVDVLHFGSLGAALEPGASRLQEIVLAARSQSTITFDPNIRPQLQGDRGSARDRVEAAVRESDVVKASDEDLAWLYPGVEPRTIARDWIGLGALLVVVTAGAAGAIAVTSTLEVEVAAQPVDVADTIGAGDSFMAGLIGGLADLGLLGAENRQKLGSIEERALDSVIERAARAAAITVSRAGANPPTRDELEEPLSR